MSLTNEERHAIVESRIEKSRRAYGEANIRVGTVPKRIYRSPNCCSLCKKTLRLRQVSCSLRCKSEMP